VLYKQWLDFRGELHIQIKKVDGEGQREEGGRRDKQLQGQFRQFRHLLSPF
jgi:hypothetical protein